MDYINYTSYTSKKLPKILEQETKDSYFDQQLYNKSITTTTSTESTTLQDYMGPSSPVSPSSNSTPALPGTGNPAVSATASAGTGTASSNLTGGFLGNSPYGTGNTSLLTNTSGYHTNTSPRPPSANGIGGSLGGQIHPAMSAATPTSIGSTYSHMHSMSHFNPSSGFSSQYSNMAGSTAADIASPHYHDMRGSTAATGWYTSPHTDPRFASEYCKYCLNYI